MTSADAPGRIRSCWLSWIAVQTCEQGEGDAWVIAEDGRSAGDQNALFCGSGGARAIDPSDSATFMRYAFRSSLKARYTVRNLGFRCARDGVGR